MPRSTSAGAMFGGERIRQPEEHGVGLRRQAIDIQRFDRRIPDFCQGGQTLGFRRSGRHRDADDRVRMPGKTAEELQPGITGHPRDADPDRRISIHQNL